MTTTGLLDVPGAQLYYAHELVPATSYRPDIDGLARHADPLVLGIGEASAQFLPARPAPVIAERTGARLQRFPGGHVGYLEAWAEFGPRLLTVLASAD